MTHQSECIFETEVKIEIKTPETKRGKEIGGKGRKKGKKRGFELRHYKRTLKV